MLSSVRWILLSLLGAHLWSKGFQAYDVHDVAVNAAGEILLTGLNLTQASFGGVTLMSKGSFDVYIVKLDKDGNHLWSVSYGGSGWDYPSAFALDSAGNIFVVGYFEGSAAFGATVLTATGPYDGFVAKVSGGDGSVLWVKQFGISEARPSRATAPLIS
jgi:hypothetical protein